MEDLVVAKQANFSGQARYLEGHINNESYRRTIDSLTQLVKGDLKVSRQGVRHAPTAEGPHNLGTEPHGFEP
ncbi:hypothetical protein BFJ68_g13115 [Fusarium oxysporum]|uniref:Uncharacterized protein n=1 Tax=Fusarium oxysporum TaxID=5507 RepID=A0A420P6H1_FUSOX|nr:hypothetical protein BFJ71_g13054 [Fusarium oxysporum]RKK99710.1 hypothetical protein BFJ68_g13115 [Fusarium oxysporum]